MSPFARRAVDRAAEAAAKPVLLPDRLGRTATAEPGGIPWDAVYEEIDILLGVHAEESRAFGISGLQSHRASSR
jgi:hypothetical protein